MSSPNTNRLENISDFRRYTTQDEIAHLPEIKERRKNTDVAFLVGFIVCAIFLLILLIYSYVNGDINRLIHGYDYCGNMCGLKNNPLVGITCSGADLKDKPYLDNINGRHTCVNSCKRFRPQLYRCSGVTFLSDFVAAIDMEPYNLMILCFSGLGVSIHAALFFRYFPQEFIWTMLVGSMVIHFGVAGYLWYMYGTNMEMNNTGTQVVAILVTIISILVALCILVLISKINIIIFFFNEAAKTIFAMPFLLLESFIIYLIGVVAIGCFLFTSLLICTTGPLKELTPGFYEYVSNAFKVVALVWNLVMTSWFMMFLLACQQVIISGAVAVHYFAKDKSKVCSPISTSLYNLIRFHLGSVAFGSLLMLFCNIIKMFIRTTSTYPKCCRLFEYCFKPINDILQYITSMGYIEIAIHGQPLCRSSYRAINLVVSNLISAIVMNFIGNFIFYLVKFLIVTVVVGIGLLLKSHYIIIIVGGFVTLICAHSFFVIFEDAIEAMYICYCEDRSVNDGISRPYYATRQIHLKMMQAQQLTSQRG